MAYKTLNLDLAKSPILKYIVYGRIGDSDMQTVTVNITSRDTPVDLTGYIITFEGITNSNRTKVFDVSGISSTADSLKKGTFNYTFPNMAFAVAGKYEIAYFSIVKGSKRDTSGEFDIIVDSNADIDAEEAKTIITEYNKLVEELHEITDKYISDSDAKFADINKKITSLQSQITEYQANVKKIADDAVSAIDSSVSTAVSTVNSSSNAAIKAVDDALKKFEAGDFYTKSETDAKFKLTINDSGAIVAGTDLDSLNIPGFYAISNKKPDTEILNYPPRVSLNSAGAMYAQIIVYKNASSGMIRQHFLDNVSGNMYMRKYYSNSWSIWKKIAIDSEVVHLTGDETIAGKKTFTDETTVSKLKATDIEVTKSHAASSSIYNGNGLVNFSRAGNMVQVSVRSMPSIPINTRITGVIPTGYRPLNDYVSITKPSRNFYFYPDGAVGTGSDALTSADGYYSFCYPTADAVPVD